MGFNIRSIHLVLSHFIMNWWKPSFSMIKTMHRPTEWNSWINAWLLNFNVEFIICCGVTIYLRIKMRFNSFHLIFLSIHPKRILTIFVNDFNLNIFWHSHYARHNDEWIQVNHINCYVFYWNRNALRILRFLYFLLTQKC